MGTKAGHETQIQDLLKHSADQLSELSIMVAITNSIPIHLLAYKIRSRNGRFSSLLGSKLPSNQAFKFADLASFRIEITRGVASIAGHWLPELSRELH